MSTQKTVHFRLEGSDFTRIVREMFLSDDSAKAYRIITTGLVGAGGIEKLAIEVLSGNKVFTGNETDGIDLQDVVDEDYKQEVAYLYAGRLKISGIWYRPCARVTSWGHEDMRNDRDKPVYRSYKVNGGYVNRGWHYCKPRETLHDHDIILETCAEPPFWYPTVLSVEAAIAACDAAGRPLEERGWVQWYQPGADADDRKRAIEYANRKKDAEDSDEGDDECETPYAGEEEYEIRRQAEREAEYAEEDRLFAERLAGYKAQILTQAHGDMLRLELEDGHGHVDVPRVPFFNWCIERVKKLHDRILPWECVSPCGLKLPMDSQWHSDWWLGAGQTLDSYRDHKNPVHQASVAKMFEIQRQLAGVRCTILVEGHGVGPAVYGKPNKRCKPGSVVILPNLSPKYLEATIDAAAVISEAGGATAHLAQVGRERALPMVIYAAAMDEFPEGADVVVDAVNGVIRLFNIEDQEAIDDG